MRSNHVAAKIAGLYILVGCLWILLSDKLLLMITSDMNVLSALQTTKGWFYVLITAGLLYLLIQRNFSAARSVPGIGPGCTSSILAVTDFPFSNSSA